MNVFSSANIAMDLSSSCFNQVDFSITESDKITLSKLKVPLPINENTRITTLRQTNLLDSTQEEEFDRFTNLCSRVFDVSPLLFRIK